MSPARLGKIIIQVCSSLAEAHLKGIVHRDIKPENIMLMRARDGTDIAKVLDFGLAKLREGTELNEVTSQGAIVGTPYFMAPEQIRGENVDARTDIYALGALMYRALTGTYPFGGPTPMAVFTKHLTEHVVPPIDRTPELGISPGLSAIVTKMLAKNPNDRFAKVEDLQTALVDEMRASGSSSLESLLDSGQIRKLQTTSSEPQPVPSIVGAAPVTVAIATRDEVEAYERKLRRQRWGAIVMAGAITMAFAGVGVKLVTAHERETFTGLEREPNDSAKEANTLPLGRGVSGFLGKRVDAQHADRDFYAFTVPGGAEASSARSVVSVHVTALPNMGMCTMIYKQGLQAPLGQYCVGKVGRDLDIPLLALEPGNYLASVTEDIDPYGALAAPFVLENVSDTYTIKIDDAHVDLGKEIEPNDGVANANEIGVGASTSGTIGWARDEDVFCAPKDAKGPLRWKVKDGVREAGGVLEATTLHDTDEGAPVRVHVSGKGTPSATDAMSPWTSAVIKADGAARCLRLRLVSDPWSGTKTTVVPNGGSEAYVVELD
jgi:serine/threonine-protein kinase